jgi:hypothetical protein
MKKQKNPLDSDRLLMEGDYTHLPWTRGFECNSDFSTLCQGFGTGCRDLYRSSRASQKNANAYRMTHMSMPKQNVMSISAVVAAMNAVPIHFSTLISDSVSVMLQASTRNESRKVNADQFFIETILA